MRNENKPALVAFLETIEMFAKFILDPSGMARAHGGKSKKESSIET